MIEVRYYAAGVFQHARTYDTLASAELAIQAWTDISEAHIARHWAVVSDAA